MPSRKDCIDDIAGRTGKSREEVRDALDDILDRADGYEASGMGRDESYARARDEMLQEQAEQDALRRRAEILDMRKESARHRYYDAVDKQIKTLAPSQAVKGPRLALEASSSASICRF